MLPVTFAPAASFPGGNVTVTHTVKNVAAAPGNAGASLSRLLLAQNQSAISPVADFGTVSFPAIAAGGMATVSRGVSIPGNTSPGLYYLVAVADDPGSILEYNELNNVGASASPIVIGPDLLATAATTLAATAPGANLSVTYTLKNQGGGGRQGPSASALRSCRWTPAARRSAVTSRSAPAARASRCRLVAA